MKMILAGFSVVYLAQVCPDLAQSWHGRLLHKNTLVTNVVVTRVLSD